MLALEERSLSGFKNANLLKHLPHNDTDVLVIDLHALQAIDLLHFVEQILLDRARSLDAKNVVRIDRTFRKTISSSYTIALVHSKVLACSNLVRVLFRLIIRN